MTTEQWRPVVGYEGRYEVSDQGRVASLVYPGSGGSGRELRGWVSNGYPCVTLSLNGLSRTFPVHNLVAAAFIGPRPHNLFIDHRDGDKANNRASNLEYVTPRENALRARRLGLVSCREWPSRKGEANTRCETTEAKIIQILTDRRSGLRLKDIAAKHGRSVNYVGSICCGAKWRHVYDRFHEGKPVPDMRIGTNHHRAGIDHETARAIKTQIASGARTVDIAKKFGVSWDTVKEIRKGRTWRHVLA